jgi:predicted nuclease with TOPRIM domain
MKYWIVIGILLALMSGAAYFYYSSTQAKIEQLLTNNAVLVENNKQLDTANNENLNTIDTLQLFYKQSEDQFNQLQSEFQSIREQNQKLKERLGKHELDVLAAAKPKLVENVINNASKNALRCFELLSGAPLTEKERNAKNEREFNSECGYLYYELTNP